MCIRISKNNESMSIYRLVTISSNRISIYITIYINIYQIDTSI